MASSPPAGWHHDPTGRGEFRWWTGTQWTYRIASGGQIFAEAGGDLSHLAAPLSGPVAGDPQAAPRGVRQVAATPQARLISSMRADVVEVRLSPGAAFRAGFFAFWGWLAASAIMAVIAFLLALVFSVCIAAGTHSTFR